MGWVEAVIDHLDLATPPIDLSASRTTRTALSDCGLRMTGRRQDSQIAADGIAQTGIA